MTDEHLGPFGATAFLFWESGWRGVLPLPAGQKSPPPTGWTGANAEFPSYMDVNSWMDDHTNGNIGIRLPEGVIGLDVDAYSGKAGATTLVGLEAKWGTLPATYRVTSREDGISGIRLYQVPDGLRWPGELGPGLEIIQRRHRYMVAPPSIHPEGRVYGWLDPNLMPCGTPRPEDLEHLTESWIQGATRGALAVDIAKQAMGDGELSEWLEGLPQGHACRRTAAAVARLARELASGSSRHEAGLRAVMHLARLANEHHTGVAQTLVQARELWLSAVSADGSRGEGEASAEWARILRGAVSAALADGRPKGVPADPCVEPLADLIGPAPGGPMPTRGADPGVGAHAERLPTPGLPSELAAPLGEAQGSNPPQVDQAENALKQWREVQANHEFEVLLARETARERLKIESLTEWVPPQSDWNLTSLLKSLDTPIAWVIDRLMPEETNILITAQFKAGKSTVVLNLIRALADGRPFLGEFACTSTVPNTVAYWNYEIGETMIRRWLRDLRIQQTDRVVGLNLRGMKVPLLTKVGRDWTVEWLRSRHVTQWAIDPWGRAINGLDENSNVEVGMMLEALDEIKALAGVRELIIVTHTGRALQTFGGERARGATRLDDWADVRWLLMIGKDPETRQQARFFRAHGRDVDVDEGRLTFDPITRILTFGDGARDPGDDATQAPQGRPRRKGPPINLENEIMRVVKEGDGLSRAEIARRINGGGNSEITKKIRALASHGLIVRTSKEGKEGNGQTVRHWPVGHPDIPRGEVIRNDPHGVNQDRTG